MGSQREKKKSSELESVVTDVVTVKYARLCVRNKQLLCCVLKLQTFVLYVSACARYTSEPTLSYRQLRVYGSLCTGYLLLCLALLDQNNFCARSTCEPNFLSTQAETMNVYPGLSVGTQCTQMKPECLPNQNKVLLLEHPSPVVDLDRLCC